MRYGANHPADLVSRAAEHGMAALALTDRDGLYGAVKFALACRSAGVRPIFGVDLAVAPAVDSAVPRPLARPLGDGPAGASGRLSRPGTAARPGGGPGTSGRRGPPPRGAGGDPPPPPGTLPPPGRPPGGPPWPPPHPPPPPPP